MTDLFLVLVAYKADTLGKVKSGSTINNILLVGSNKCSIEQEVKTYYLANRGAGLPKATQAHVP